MSTKEKKQNSEHGYKKVAKDYTKYEMTLNDKVIAILIGFAIGIVVSWTFFNSVPFAIICGIACTFISPRFYSDYRKKKVLEQLRLQFRDLLDSLSASYAAGKNTMSSFQASEEDMISIYGESSDIVEEIRLINGGLKNNVNIELLLSDFAKRSGIEDIQSFADVFEVCNRQGGNLKRVVSETRDIISDKTEIELEIGTLLAGNKNELNIMMVMPIVVILMLNSLGTGTANENTPVNVLLKLFCIGLFGLAYYIGKKITNIDI